MSLEDTLLKLVEAVNRQAAAMEKKNELVSSKLVPFITASQAIEEAPVAQEQAVETRKPRTQKPKPEPTPEPEVENPVELPVASEPVQEPKVESEEVSPRTMEVFEQIQAEKASNEKKTTVYSGPIGGQEMTAEQYRIAIREAVRPKIAGNVETKAKWAALLAEWKVKNINEIEAGDLPDFLEQAKAL